MFNKILIFFCLIYLPQIYAQNNIEKDTLDYISHKYYPVYGIGSIDDYLKNAKIKKIIYKHTACFGTCPSYEVTFNNNGDAEYNGKYFVRMVGRYKGKIEKHIFARLTYLIDKFNILNLRNDYSSRVSDASAAILTIEFKNKEVKGIRNYNNYGPIELWGIDKVIEEITKEINWYKVK